MKWNTWNQLQEYIKKTGWAIIGIAAAAFCAHGPLLFSDTIGVDTEFIMKGMHNFDLLGRQGLIWLGKLLGLNSFNLYYAQILALLFLILAPVAFGFLFWSVSGQRKGCLFSLFLLGAAFVASPFWVTQLYFLNQSPQITFSCALIPFLILLAEKARTTSSYRWLCLPMVVLLMQPVFSSYQVLILLYVTGVAATFLFSSFREERSFRQQLQWILYHAGIFLVGFFLYLAISRLFFLEGNNYLQGQIWWGRLELSETLKLCFDTLRGLFGYNPPYTTGMYRFLALILILLTVYRIVTKSAPFQGSTPLFVLTELFLISSPCVFILFYGGAIPDRMQLILPFSQGCILYLTVLLLVSGRADIAPTKMRLPAQIAVLALALALCRDASLQLNFCSRLYYTDAWRYQYDRQIAADIYEEIIALKDMGIYRNSTFRKILFLGYPDLPYNDTCVLGNVMGISEFKFDCFEETIYRHRAISFMQQIGYPIEPYFKEEEEAAFWESFPQVFGSAVDAMPCYPHTGYVQVLSDEESGQTYLVIKLGQEWWFWD